MSRDRRLKIEGGAFFNTLALADGGGNATELSGRFGERARGHGASRLGPPCARFSPGRCHGHGFARCRYASVVKAKPSTHRIGPVRPGHSGM